MKQFFNTMTILLVGLSLPGVVYASAAKTEQKTSAQNVLPAEAQKGNAQIIGARIEQGVAEAKGRDELQSLLEEFDELLKEDESKNKKNDTKKPQELARENELLSDGEIDSWLAGFDKKKPTAITDEELNNLNELLEEYEEAQKQSSGKHNKSLVTLDADQSVIKNSTTINKTQTMPSVNATQGELGATSSAATVVSSNTQAKQAEKQSQQQEKMLPDEDKAREAKLKQETAERCEKEQQLKAAQTQAIKEKNQRTFIEAAKNGDAEAAKKLLEQGVDINAQDENGDTALMLAIKSRSPEIVEALIAFSSKINLEAVNQKGDTALTLAAFYGEEMVVDALINAGANIEVVNSKNGYTALMLAASTSKIAVVKLLIKARANIEAVNSKNGYTALVCAVGADASAVVDLLINAKPNIEKKVALGIAKRTGNQQIIKLLEGAQKKQDAQKQQVIAQEDRPKETENKTKKEHAKQEPSEEKQHVTTAQTQAIKEKNQRTFIEAARNGDAEAVKKLLEQGVDINAQDETGDTALMLAAYSNNAEMIEFLIQHDADVSVKNKKGRTAINIASDKKMKDMLQKVYNTQQIAKQKDAEKRNAQAAQKDDAQFKKEEKARKKAQRKAAQAEEQQQQKDLEVKKREEQIQKERIAYKKQAQKDVRAAVNYRVTTTHNKQQNNNEVSITQNVSGDIVDEKAETGSVSSINKSYGTEEKFITNPQEMNVTSLVQVPYKGKEKRTTGRKKIGSTPITKLQQRKTDSLKADRSRDKNTSSVIALTELSHIQVSRDADKDVSDVIDLTELSHNNTNTLLTEKPKERDKNFSDHTKVIELRHLSEAAHLNNKNNAGNNHANTVEQLVQDGAHLKTGDKADCMVNMPLITVSTSEQKMNKETANNYNAVTYNRNILPGSLISAVEKEDITTIQKALSEGLSIEAISDDAEQATMLMYAIKNNHEALVKWLLFYGASVQRKGNQQSWPLLVAVENNNPKIAHILINADASLGEQKKNGDSVLHVACQKGYLEIVSLLLRYGADPDLYCKLQRETPLYSAASAGHAEVVQLLRDHGARVDIKASLGYAALMHAKNNKHHVLSSELILAAENGDIASINFALRRGLSLEAVSNDSEQTTLLLHAIHNNQEKLVDYLLRSGACFQRKNDEQDWPLLAAVTRGNIHIVRRLLRERARVDEQQQKSGDSALRTAVRQGNTEIVALLLEHQANIHIRDASGNTPLHNAVVVNHPELVQLLIRYKADTNIKNAQGYTALTLAEEYGHAEIVQILEKKSHNLEQKTIAEMHARYQGCQAMTEGPRRLLSLGEKRHLPNIKNELNVLSEELITAAQTGNVTTIHNALSNGLSIDAVDNDVIQKPTLLVYAIFKNQKEIVEFLLNNEAKVNKTSRDGFCPIVLAAQYSSIEIAEMLIKYGADVNEKNLYGITALSVAAQDGRTDMVSLLLQRGADVNICDSNRYTPLHYAARFGHTDIVKLLLQHGADFEARGIDGSMASDLANRSNHTAIVALLAQKKVDESKLFKNDQQVAKEMFELHMEQGKNFIAELQQKGDYSWDCLFDRAKFAQANEDRVLTLLGWWWIHNVWMHNSIAENTGVLDQSNPCSLCKNRNHMNFNYEKWGARMADKGNKYLERDLRTVKMWLKIQSRGKDGEREQMRRARVEARRTANHIKRILNRMIGTIEFKLAQEKKNNNKIDRAKKQIQQTKNRLFTPHNRNVLPSELISAAKIGNMQPIEQALRRGLSLEAVSNDSEQATLLLHAIHNNREKLVDFLLESGASCQRKNDEQDWPLLAAVTRGNINIVRRLLREGACVDEQQQKSGNSALRMAVKLGNTEMVTLLLECRAKVNIHDKDGKTPLHHAAFVGNIKMVQILMRYGANTNIKNVQGDTALMLAEKNGHKKVIQLLEIDKTARTMRLLDCAMGDFEKKYGKTNTQGPVSNTASTITSSATATRTHF